MAVVLCCLKNKPQNCEFKGLNPTKKLILWLVTTSILLISCLSHVYVMPFLTFEPDSLFINQTCQNNSNEDFKGKEPLEITLYHTFDSEGKKHKIHHDCLNEGKDFSFDPRNKKFHYKLQICYAIDLWGIQNPRSQLGGGRGSTKMSRKAMRGEGGFSKRPRSQNN